MFPFLHIITLHIPSYCGNIRCLGIFYKIQKTKKSNKVCLPSTSSRKSWIEKFGSTRLPGTEPFRFGAQFVPREGVEAEYLKVSVVASQIFCAKGVGTRKPLIVNLSVPDVGLVATVSNERSAKSRVPFQERSEG